MASSGQGMSKTSKAFSCVRCFERKVKCDKQYPCSACVKSQVECEFRVPAPPRRRKKRTQEEILRARLKQYESLLKSHGIAPKPDEDGSTTLEVDHDSFQAMTVNDSPHSSRRSVDTEPPELEGGKLFTGGGKSTFVENNLWKSLSDDIPNPRELSPDSSDEDYTQEANDPFHVDLVLGAVPKLSPASTLHPPPDQIFKIWQIFLDNVNPLTKIIHQPTVQNTLFEAAFNPDKVRRGFEALMFGIYCTAISSLSDEECQTMFGAPRLTLLAKYSLGMRKALMKARFLGTADLEVLQGFVLYLFTMRTLYRPRSVWVLAGVASRIAQGMGLHQDGEALGLSFFEAEMRRRLWWQIAILDARSAELSGSKRFGDIWRWNTKVPLNINDSDMYPEMKEAPAEHTKPTEMVSCLLRYELGHYMRSLKYSEAESLWAVGAPNASVAEKDKLVDQLEKVLEEKFLRYLDLSVPVQFHAAIVGRVAIWSLRMMAHHPRHYTGKTVPLLQIPQSERDLLFSLSMKVIECDNTFHSTRITKRFLWHSYVYFQWDALIYILNDLRVRREGTEVEKAWQEIEQVFQNHSHLISDTSRALHVAIGNLVLKVWNSRRQYTRQHPDQVPNAEPQFITMLRNQRLHRKERQDSTKAPAPTQPVDFHPFDFDNFAIPAYQDLPQASAIESFDAPSDPSNSGDTPMEDVGPIDWNQWDLLLQDFEVPE